MFTNDNRRNLRAAAITTFAAASFIASTAGFAAPKRDVGHGRIRENFTIVEIVHPANLPSDGGNDVRFGEMSKKDQTIIPEPASPSLVRIVTPSPFPTGTGHDVSFGEMRKKDQTVTPEPASPSLVRIVTPSPFPTGTGHDVSFGEMRKKDKKPITPEPVSPGYLVHIVTPSPFPTGSGQDLSFGEMRASSGGATPTAASPSPRFIQSLDLSSGGRWVGGSTSTAPARSPFTDGRAWVSVTRDGQNGLVATAGWSFLLK